VVAVGGDGTVNEVVNGLVDQTGSGLSSLGCLFTGRGCDGVRNFGLPRNFQEACRRLVEGQDVTVDLGLVHSGRGGERYFVGSAGAGFDAATAQKAQVGKIGGIFSYLPALATTLFTYRNQRMTVEADGKRLFDGPAAAVVVANGPYYGGGMKIAPGAELADGWLDLIVLGDLGALEIIWWTPSVYRGKHLANPKVTAARGRTVSIEAQTPLPVHVDGEVPGETPVRISVHPAALRLRI
jgi:YegS/Rv2252/BmrU family lipid kinase